MARVKKYKMNPIDKKFSEKGGFTAQFLSDGNSVDGETEILPGVISDGGFKIAPEIAQRLIDKYFAACLNYGARTGENVKVGQTGFVLMSIKGWYANKDSKAKKDNVRIRFRLANEIRPTAAFTLSNVIEGATLMLVSVTGEGCSLDHVKAGEKATINGKYTKMLEGDKVTAIVGEGDTKIEAECEILGSGDQFIDIVVPKLFCDGALNGKEITFVVESRCGDAEAGTQTKDLSATLIAEDETPAEPRIVSMIGEMSGKDGVSKGWYDPMTITLENASTEGAKVRRVLYDGDVIEAETGWDMESVKLEIISPTVMKVTFEENLTRHTFENWRTKYHPVTEVKLANGTILSIDMSFEEE